MPMTIQELYDKSKELGIEKDEVKEAIQFIELHEMDEERPNALCGYCNVRGSKECTFPDRSKLWMPACLTFK